MPDYVKLMKLSTNYSRKMNELRNRIFGEVVRPTAPANMKVVKLFSEMPVHKNPEKTINYYPRHIETHKLMAHLRNYGLFRDEHKDFQEEMLRLRELRGKRIWFKEKKKWDKDK